MVVTGTAHQAGNDAGEHSAGATYGRGTGDSSRGTYRTSLVSGQSEKNARDPAAIEARGQKDKGMNSFVVFCERAVILRTSHKVKAPFLEMAFG